MTALILAGSGAYGQVPIHELGDLTEIGSSVLTGTSKALQEEALRKTGEAAIAKSAAALTAGAAGGTEGVAAAGFFETIANQLENLYQLEMTYGEIVEGNDVLRQAYNASRLISSAPELRALYSELSEYNFLISALSSDLSSYSADGKVSAARLYSTARMLAYSESVVLDDFAYIKKMLFTPGMTMDSRLNILKGYLQSIRQHKGQLYDVYAGLLRERKEQEEDELNRVANYVYASAFGEVPELKDLSGRKRGELLSGDEKREADDVLREAKEYNQQRKEYTLENLEKKKGSLVSDAINLTTAIVGFMALFLLVFAYVRRHRGERQTQDAMYKWGVGLIFFIVALQLVKILVA